MLKTIIIGFLLTLFISCNNSGERSLYIASTTDVHGMIFGNDPSSGEESTTSMSKISGYLKENFESTDLLMLDNGDNLQGTPSVYYYNFENMGVDHIWPRVLNYMNYDAITVGNHDIEAGHNVYDRIRDEFDAPLLAANAIDYKTGDPYFEPYVMIRKNGLDIAVMGLITPGVPGWLPEVLYEGIEFMDMVETASKWMPEILEKEPDLVIGLFHSGWNETYGGGEVGSYKNQNASLQVAREVDGFDIIIIGHDHDIMNDFVVNNSGDSILIMDGGSHARFLSLAEVKLSGRGDSRRVNITGKMVKIDTLDSDSDFDEYFNNDYKLVEEYITRPIGRLDKSVSSRESYFGDSRFMDLIHKIQLETSGADISFAAPLSFDVQIDEGELTVSDMFDLYRYENMLYTVSLTGEQIDKYLEYSSSLWFSTFSEGSNSILKYQDKESGQLLNRYYNFDSAAGIEYSVDLTKKDGEKVTILSLSDGKEFEESATYTVALNSYRGSGGGGHLTRGCGLSESEIESRIIKSTDKDLRYYMMKWFEQQGNVTLEKDNNWVIEPSGILKELVSDEYNNLFNSDYK